VHINGNAPLFLLLNIILAALFAGFTTLLVVRREPRTIKLVIFAANALLFPVYLQVAWLPAAYLAGLAFATLSFYKTSLVPGFWLFAVSAAVIAAGIAWLLAHGLKRLMTRLCSGFIARTA